LKIAELFMKINVGSKNPVKIAAVRDAVRLYPKLFPDAKIVGIDIDSGTFGHPKNLKETVEGAIDRAKKAFTDCSYSFGLEGGLLEVPLTKTGYMEVGACAVYDGKNICLGLSPACEWPKEVAKLILSGKADGSQAFKQLGLTEHKKMGAVEGGIIGFLTKGRLTREEQTKQSIIMALIQLERSELY
jgi:inosine/xanthosine triphosphatase